MRRTILPMDELNRLEQLLTEKLQKSREQRKKIVQSADDDDDYLTFWLLTQKDVEEVEDAVKNILENSYRNGAADTYSDLELESVPNLDGQDECVNKKIGGKTWKQRVEEYLEQGGSLDEVMRVATTEAHRDYNAGAYDAAMHGGATSKEWVCTFHNSRDSHMYLHGTKVGIDDEFYTFMGNHAMYPGQFGVAEEDVNCLCYLKFDKG